MERKDFLKSACALCGLAFIPAAIIESCSKQQTYTGPTNVNFTLDLSNSQNIALNTVGGSVTTNGIIIVRLNVTTFKAFSATCTHQGCTIGYNSSNATFVCPCHGGVYSASTGAVISGPPPTALTIYNTSLSGNILTVTS